MAEFGSQATQLSAPQGAGSAPLAPVQQQAVNTSSIQMLAAAAPAIGQGIANFMQKQAKDQETAVVSAYTQEQATINAAIADGTLQPAEAAGRSKALFSKYAANFAGNMESLNKARTALSGGSELGTAEDALKTDQELRKSAKLAAQADGVEFYGGMSKQAEDALLKAHSSGVRIQKQLEQQIKINAEARAQGSWDRDMQDAKLKDDDIRT